ALMQLRFTSLAMTSLWRDLHPQECAHAGRTKQKARAVKTARAFVIAGMSGVLLNRMQNSFHVRTRSA
ncbi:hypothetical protein, partial [Paraburkholderia rhizosphaerae]|uniref:hypothetical protein n=1 Tax=Paraburkholderia rhizosphaerae TaxID=480658 RepID=UPI001AB05F34